MGRGNAREGGVAPKPHNFNKVVTPLPSPTAVCTYRGGVKGGNNKDSSGYFAFVVDDYCCHLMVVGGIAAADEKD